MDGYQRCLHAWFSLDLAAPTQTANQFAQTHGRKKNLTQPSLRFWFPCCKRKYGCYPRSLLDHKPTNPLSLSSRHILLACRRVHNKQFALLAACIVRAGLCQRSRTPAGRHRDLLADVHTADHHGYQAHRVPWPFAVRIRLAEQQRSQEVFLQTYEGSSPMFLILILILTLTSLITLTLPPTNLKP